LTLPVRPRAVLRDLRFCGRQDDEKANGRQRYGLPFFRSARAGPYTFLAPGILPERPFFGIHAINLTWFPSLFVKKTLEDGKR